jgi:beta-lactamase class A
MLISSPRRPFGQVFRNITHRTIFRKGRRARRAEAAAVEFTEGAAPHARLIPVLSSFAERTGGTVGVAAVHAETGRRVLYNDTRPFQMASTYKVPIALFVMALVDRGQLALDELVTVEPRDFVIGGTIGDRLRPGETALSVRLLIERMLIESDNSATDVLLRIAGGPAAVTAHLRALGLPTMRIDRPTGGIIADAYGTTFPDGAEERWEYFERTRLPEGLGVPAAAAQRFDDELLDITTPAEMTALLERLHRRDPALVSKERADQLVSIMQRCSTGGARLRALLPAGTVVADKTGTFGGTVNDAGIITLPQRGGHLVVSVFIRGATAETAACERVIAEIARTLFDYFLFA